MCDTFVVTPSGSRNRKLWFAKNSDRSPNEPNIIINQPAKRYDISDSPSVELTYITIPQVAETYGLLMVKPVWTWGCEMGVNEHGVCIGNEAVFTKGEYSDTGLLGMDICRLVLERCTTAEEGMRLIGSLLEEYGQGGNCGFDSEFFYDNSFIVSDCAEAFVVETSDRLWIAKRCEDIHSISNFLSIYDEWDYCCDALAGVNRKLNFAKKHTEKLHTHFAGGSLRRYCVYQTLLNARDGKPIKSVYSALLGGSAEKREKAVGIGYDTCKEVLRSHLPNGGYTESPCMHYGGVVGSHTTGSLIVCPEDGFIGITGGSTPCRSVYMPYRLDGELSFGEDPNEAERYWLRRELIQRNLLSGCIELSGYLSEAAALERDLESLSSAFTAPNSDGFNQRVYNMENEFTEKYFSMCSRDLDRLKPVSGAIGYKKRWMKKNEALAARISQLGI
ncbi:MAG: C69 family dipeptidase [Oscillospiraceae bacterium]|nr:C69 family dipeptidase [Oscillospiraceae bacterium]